MSDISDLLIAEQIRGNYSMATWVIKNRLRQQGYNVTTKKVREAMRRLEAIGVVKLDEFSNPNNYRWKLIKD